MALSTDGSLDAVSAATFPGSSKSVADTIKDAIGTIGENMTLRRTAKLSVDSGVVATYVHNAVSDRLGKLGVLVALKSTGNADELAAIGRQIAMHVAATNPLAVTKDDVDPAVAERERRVFSEQARESGKPENIIEKMVEGRMRKFYEEVALLSQAFVIDPDQTVGDGAEGRRRPGSARLPKWWRSSASSSARVSSARRATSRPRWRQPQRAEGASFS